MSVFGKALPSSVRTIHRGLCRTAAAAGGLDRDELAALVVLLRHGTAEALAQLFFYCSADGAEGEERVSVDQLIIMLKAACRDAGLDMNASSAATVASGTKSALDRDQFCALFRHDESQSVLANVLVKLSGAAAAHLPRRGITCKGSGAARCWQRCCSACGVRSAVPAVCLPCMCTRA